jgi:hypothetical protein
MVVEEAKMRLAALEKRSTLFAHMFWNSIAWLELYKLLHLLQ